MTYNYTASSTKLSSITGANARTFSYDAYGNVTGNSLHTFTYDLSGAMTYSSSPSRYYTYDAHGRRIRVQEGSQYTYTHYSKGGQLLHKEQGGVETDYIYAGSLLVATKEGSTVNYLHTDLLGSPVAGKEGSTGYTEHYTPWGDESVQSVKGFSAPYIQFRPSDGRGFLMRASIAGVLAAACLPGCVTHGESFDLPYTVTDSPSLSLIEISYVNHAAESVCMDVKSFPNAEGEIDTGGGVLSLIVNGSSYPIRDMVSSYCPKCVYFVLPGERVMSRILYTDFNLPPDLFGAEKTLRFSPKGTWCKTPKRCVPDNKLSEGLLQGRRVTNACD